MTSAKAPAWQATLIAGVALFACLLAGYWSTWSAMAEIWMRSDTYQHGLVVPPIALWLVWRERQRLAAWTPSPTLWPTLPFALLAFLWLLGALTSVNAVTQFAVIAMLVCAVAALLGRALSKEIAFPLLFLFFAVPIGDFMMPQLMEWTANFTVIALKASGIPVYREGLQFVIPTGIWSVVEACSGIRYVIASLTVGTLFAYLTYHSFKRRLIFIGVSLAVPIVANWLRAYLIVLLGHVSGNKLATGADHLVYGWVFFGIVIAIMFAIGARWGEPETHSEPPAAVTATMARRTTSPWPVAVLLAILAISAPIAQSILKASTDRGPLTLAPADWQGGWHVDSEELTDWKPAYSGATAEIRATLSTDEQRVGLYIGFYRNQDYDHKLITSTNMLVTYQDRQWRSLSAGQSELASANLPLATRQAAVIGPNQRLNVYSWYWIDGQNTTSDMLGKLLTVRSMLLGRGDDSAVIMVYADSDQTEAVKQFVGTNQSTITALLETARQIQR